MFKESTPSFDITFELAISSLPIDLSFTQRLPFLFKKRKSYLSFAP